MDPSAYRSLVLKKLLASPVVLVPAGLGTATCALALTLGAFGAPVGFLAFLGLTGILAGIGMAATRWVFGFETITQTALEELQGENERSQTISLDRLEQTLKVDHDPAPPKAFRPCENSTAAWIKPASWATRLIAPCCRKSRPRPSNSTNRASNRWPARWNSGVQPRKWRRPKAANRCSMPARSLIAEVGKSVYHLGKTVDHLQASMLKRDRQDDSLARMRQELDMGLDVAQRIEQRMDQLHRLGQEGPSISDVDKPSGGGTGAG